MLTYTDIYLDDHEAHTLAHCQGINITAVDCEGQERVVGHYLERMAEHRRCGVPQLQNGFMLAWKARTELLPTADPTYWRVFGGPISEHAEGLAEERRRLIATLDDALTILAEALQVATEPADLDHDGEPARPPREGTVTFHNFLRDILDTPQPDVPSTDATAARAR